MLKMVEKGLEYIWNIWLFVNMLMVGNFPNRDTKQKVNSESHKSLPEAKYFSI